MGQPRPNAGGGNPQDATVSGADHQYPESLAADCGRGAAVDGSASPPAHYRAGDLPGQAAVAVIDQIRAVAKHRLQSKIETAAPPMVQAVLAALAQILEMP